jgi:hypothetical protein
MVGKYHLKLYFCHNQKTDLCNQKLFPTATLKKHNGTTGMVGKYHLKLYFCHNQKTDTTA